MAGSWRIITSREYRDWRGSLSDEDRDSLQAAIEHLERLGPGLGRPLTGKITSAKTYKAMKELIPPIGNIRVLFIFDPERRAVLLLGGDKTNNWDGWYRTNVPRAEEIYTRHLAGMTAAQAASQPPTPPTSRKGKKR